MIIGSRRMTFPEVNSTNSLLANMACRDTIPEGTVVIAGFQTAGRGQKENRWESRRGENLTFSILLYPDFIGAEEQFILSMSISLGITDFLSEFTGECRIKWPNDIYVGNDKIAGILIENSIEGNIIRRSIAGIGFNLNQTEFSFAPNPVSLRMITGKVHFAEKELESILIKLDKRYKELIAGNKDKMRTDYIRQLFRLNEWSQYSASGRTFTGCLMSVSDDGKLQLQNKDGKVEEYLFKDIEFIL